MALSNPIDAFMQAAQAKERNRRQALQDAQGIGQNLGDIGEQVKKAMLQKQLSGMMGQMNTPQAPQQGPQLPGVGMSPAAKPPASGMGAPGQPFNGVDQSKLFNVVSQLYPEIAGKMMQQRLGIGQKQSSPWRVVQGMMSGNNPIQQNEMTGEVRAVPLNATPTGRGNSSFGSGSVTWDSASDQDKALAKALYDGNIRSFDLGYRDRTVGTKLANEYANKMGLPAYQSYGGDVKAGMSKNLAFGKMGMNALSLNTALGHANSALDAYQNVANMNQRFLNVPLNKLRSQTNDPNVIKLQTTLNALSGELATVFKGSAGTDQEIGHWVNVLSEDLTPRQAQGAIQQVNDLLNSRLQALQYQQGNVMGARPGDRQLISPHGQELSKKFSEINNSMGQTKTLNGKTYKKVGNQWFEQ